MASEVTRVGKQYCGLQLNSVSLQQTRTSCIQNRERSRNVVSRAEKGADNSYRKHKVNRSVHECMKLAGSGVKPNEVAIEL